MIGRELTKKFEQIASISAKEIPAWLAQAQSLKGEFIILVAGRQTNIDPALNQESLIFWANALSPYLGSKEIATILAQTLGSSKKEAYQIALDIKDLKPTK